MQRLLDQTPPAATEEDWASISMSECTLVDAPGSDARSEVAESVDGRSDASTLLASDHSNHDDLHGFADVASLLLPPRELSESDATSVTASAAPETLDDVRPGDIFLMPTNWRKFGLPRTALTVGRVPCDADEGDEAAEDERQRRPSWLARPSFFVPCRVLWVAAARFCCKGARNHRLVHAQSLLDGATCEGKAHMDYRVADHWQQAGWVPNEYLLLDLDDASGATLLFDEATGEERRDIWAPARPQRQQSTTSGRKMASAGVASAPWAFASACASHLIGDAKLPLPNSCDLRSELVTAYRRAEQLGAMLVVCVARAEGFEGIVGFREDEETSMWRTWCGEVPMSTLRAAVQ